jgi:tetratricopeptide (TPR) repeat protein
MNLKTSWESKLSLRSASLITFAFVLYLAQSGFAQSSRPPVLTAREIAQQARPSVVMVVTEDSSGNPVMQGSGFFVRDDLIATNYHVIEDARRIKIKLAGRREFYVVQEVAHQNKARDLALLKVGGLSAKALPLSNGAQVDVGDDVFVLSNPEGLEGTFSQGIISAIRDRNLIQITAPISKGSSGAPVMNIRGEVIGVAVGLNENGQNLNFAIPEIFLRVLLSPPAPTLPIYGDPEYRKHIPQERRADEPSRSPKSLADSPKNLTGNWFDKGKSYLSQERYLEAIEAFKQAIRVNPNDWQAYSALGVVYGLLERREEAIDAYKQTIKINPDDYDAHIFLGLAYQITERHEEAINVFRLALRLKPASQKAREYLRVSYETLGTLYAKNERYQESVEAYKQAIKISPPNADTFLLLGMSYSRLERLQESIQAYKQAIRLKPNFVDAHYLLGYTYLDAGDEGSALRQYKILKRLDPEKAEELFNAIYK